MRIGDQMTVVATLVGTGAGARSVVRNADHVPHAPRVIAGGDPRVVGELGALAVDARPSRARCRCGGSARCRHRRAGRRGRGAPRGSRARPAPRLRRSTRTRPAARRWHRARTGCGASARALRSASGPTAAVSPSAPSSRLARTVHCSVPRDTPAYASITPRFGYLPSPNPSESEPSPAPAIAQIFSVQDRSDCETVANVSTIWCASSSSSGPSGPSVGHRPCFTTTVTNVNVSERFVMALLTHRDPLVVGDALARWMAERTGDDVRVVHAEHPSIGYSSETVLVDLAGPARKTRSRRADARVRRAPRAADGRHLPRLRPRAADDRAAGGRGRRRSRSRRRSS